MPQVKLDVCTFVALFKAVKQWHLEHRSSSRGVSAPVTQNAEEHPEKHLQREARYVSHSDAGILPV